MSALDLKAQARISPMNMERKECVRKWNDVNNSRRMELVDLQ